MKVHYKKLDNGKTLRISTTDMQSHIVKKLTNNPLMEIHQAQIDIYRIKSGEVIDRQYLRYEDAVAFGQAIKKDFSDLGYRIYQIVE